MLCFAARSGKEQTFALLDEWIPPTKKLDCNEALAELTRRYFVGHGPATLQDFVWWTSLKVSDTKVGLDNVGSQLSQVAIDGTVYWMAHDLPVLPNARRTAYQRRRRRSSRLS